MPRYASAVIFFLVGLVCAETSDTFSFETNADKGILTHDLDNATYLSALGRVGVSVARGDSVRFQIKGNPSTGYDWVLDGEAANGAFEVERDFIVTPAADSDQELNGAAGTYYFTLTAGESVPDDNVQFLIQYKRSWEKTSVKEIEIPVYIF